MPRSPDIPAPGRPDDPSHRSPAHLGAAGSAVYAAAITDLELSIPETAALLQAAETLDVLRIIEDRLRADAPVTVSGRPHPLLTEARQQRATLVRLLGMLDLRLDDSDAPASGASRAASRAASARGRQRDADRKRQADEQRALATPRG